MLRVRRFVVGGLETNCYILFSDFKKEAAIIDPGGNTRLLNNEISKERCKLKYIINTHYHPDHTLCNFEIKQAHPAPVLIHEAEKEYVKFEADRYLLDKDRLKIGRSSFEVIHTPGHTPGSICLFGKNVRSHLFIDQGDFEKKGKRLIFTGDTLFKNGCGRTDLAGGSNKDMAQSLKKLKEVIKPKTTVYSGHGDIYETS